MSWGETLYLQKLIKGQRTLVASEDSYMTLTGRTGGEETFIAARVKMNTSGSCKLFFKGLSSNYSGATVDIKVNGESRSSVFATTTTNDIYSSPITFNKNDVIEIIFDIGYATYAGASYIDLCAKVVDGSLATIL